MKIPPEVLIVAQHLGEMRGRVVFVGGMVREILVTDPAVTGRPTKDVDVILDVASPVQRAQIDEVLRGLGFREDMSEDAPICRRVLRRANKGEDLPVDFMPLDPAILGFSNVWYPDAFEEAVQVETASGMIRVIDAPHFLATKLESYSSRGGGDYYHHDLEDVLAVVDGRATLQEEMEGCPVDLRAFIAQEIRRLLADRDFLRALPGNLPPDPVSQARLPVLLSRLQKLAETATALSTDQEEPWELLDSVRPEPPAPSDALVQPEAPSASALSWTPLRSSNIRHFSYQLESRSLSVTFRNGGRYEYYDVPYEVFAGWKQAASAGRYHHRWVKRYRYRRIHR